MKLYLICHFPPRFEDKWVWKRVKKKQITVAQTELKWRPITKVKCSKKYLEPTIDEQVTANRAICTETVCCCQGRFVFASVDEQVMIPQRADSLLLY